MKTIQNEMQKLKLVKAAFDWLCDGNTDAAAILIFLKGNYKQWADMFTWLKVNKKRGQGIVELFKNESPDGGGYHLGAMYILSRLKGNKNSIEQVKINELL
jgi:hypothetical protein